MVCFSLRQIGSGEGVESHILAWCQKVLFLSCTLPQRWVCCSHLICHHESWFLAPSPHCANMQCRRYFALYSRLSVFIHGSHPVTFLECLKYLSHYPHSEKTPYYCIAVSLFVCFTLKLFITVWESFICHNFLCSLLLILS